MQRGFGTLGVAYIIVASLYAGAMYVASHRSLTGDISLAASRVYDAAAPYLPAQGTQHATNTSGPVASEDAGLRVGLRPSKTAPDDPEGAASDDFSVSSPEVAASIGADVGSPLENFSRNKVEFSEVYFAPIAAAELSLDVESRLRDRLTSDLFAQFDLFIYVSKATDGPWAQDMYVFEKDGGELELLHNWPVSTGRERAEYTPAGSTTSSATPAGYFQFDRNRMFRHYRSVQWDAPMPNAMFFNWMDRGRLTGVAIHSATGTGVSDIGSRASAGCIRLSPEASATLFRLVREQFRGSAPVFAYDSRTGSSSRDGELAEASDGSLEYVDGYRALIIVDTYGGGDSEPIF